MTGSIPTLERRSVFCVFTGVVFLNFQHSPGHFLPSFQNTEVEPPFAYSYTDQKHGEECNRPGGNVSDPERRSVGIVAEHCVRAGNPQNEPSYLGHSCTEQEYEKTAFWNLHIFRSSHACLGRNDSIGGLFARATHRTTPRRTVSRRTAADRRAVRRRR